MKKVLFVLFCFTIVLMQAAVAFAIDAKTDGNDVLVPDRVVKAITSYDANKPVYAAYDSNGWFVRGADMASAEVLAGSKMKKEGNFWRAKGMKGKRFQVVQLKDTKYTGESVNWAKLENFIPANWISEDAPGICILVK